MRKILNILLIYLYISSSIVNNLILKKEHEHLREEVLDILDLGPDVYHKMSPLVFIGIVERDGQFDAAEFIKEYKRVQHSADSYDHSEETIQILKEKYPEQVDLFERTVNKRLLLEDESYANIISSLNQSIEKATHTDIEEMKLKLIKIFKETNNFQNNLSKDYTDEEFAKLGEKLEKDEETIKLFEKFFVKSSEIKGRNLKLDLDFDSIFPIPLAVARFPFAPRVLPGTISDIPSTYQNSKMINPFIQCVLSCPNYTNPLWFWSDPFNVLNFYFATFEVVKGRFSNILDGISHFAIRPDYKKAHWGNPDGTMWYQSCTDYENFYGAPIYRLPYWNQRECDYVPTIPVMYCTCDFGEIFNQISCCPDKYNCLHSMDGGTFKRFGYCYPSKATRKTLLAQGIDLGPIIYSSTSQLNSKYYSYGRVPPEILNALNDPDQWKSWRDFYPVKIETTKLWWYQVAMKWFKDPEPYIPKASALFR